MMNDLIHVKHWFIHAWVLIDMFCFHCVYEWLCFVIFFLCFKCHALAVYVCMFMFMGLDAQMIWCIVESSSPVRGSRTLHENHVVVLTSIWYTQSGWYEMVFQFYILTIFLLIEDMFCNIPDPPTGEEGAMIHQIIWSSSPMNMNIHTYNAEA